MKTIRKSELRKLIETQSLREIAKVYRNRGKKGIY